MSALIYEISSEHVIVGMDTLSLLPNKKPFKYVDKIFLLPCLKAAICTTGYFNVLTKWLVFIQTQTVIKDIFSLKPWTPKLLEMAKECNLPDNATNTLYHFGFSEKEKRFDGFAVEVKKDVKVRDLQQNSVGIKPYGSQDVSDEYLAIREGKGIFEAMVETIKRLKVIDEGQPIEDRLGIGGEIHILQMRPGEQVIVNCHRFEDYDEVFKEMIRNPDLIRIESNP